jgi:hypothetical protein
LALVPFFHAASALDARGQVVANLSVASKVTLAKKTQASVHVSSGNGKAQVLKAAGPFTPSDASTMMERRVRRLLNQHRHPLHNQHKEEHHKSLESFQSESGDDLESTGLVNFMDDSSTVQQASGVLRPGAGGDADVIEFGMYAKNFYGADLKSNTFRMDIVVTLRWLDVRAAELVPSGLKRVVLSAKQAATKLWQPGMVITNHDIHQYEVISSSVEVYKSGEVRKVERSQVKVSDNFELNSYPFDTQEFVVKIASSKYMANDVVFAPLPVDDNSGLSKELFEGCNYYLNSWTTSVNEEADGELVKSRGLLSISVSRHLDKYTQDHLVPTAIVLMISWAVFYFPFVTPFITPRLVLSIVALLTFTNLMIKSSSLLPGAAPFNWNDLFNQMVQGLMFATIVMNIFAEVCFHHFKLEALGTLINHEGKVFLPVLSVFNIFCILGMGNYGLVSLLTAALFVQFAVIASIGCYAYWCIKRFNVAAKEKAKQEAAEALRTPRETPRDKDMMMAAGDEAGDADGGDGADGGDAGGC